LQEGTPFGGTKGQHSSRFAMHWPLQHLEIAVLQEGRQKAFVEATVVERAENIELLRNTRRQTNTFDMYLLPNVELIEFNDLFL
jgi:hypothetical protein